jgi:SIR2-like domain
MQTQVHKMGTAEASSIIRSLRAGSPVVFAGSGVSIWSPSGMPSGQEFIASLFDALFDVTFPLLPEEKPVIEALFSDMPFEHMLDVCPDPKSAAELIIELYGKSAPNPIHQALARSLRRREVSAVVTTNYDSSIETALASEVGHPVPRVVTEHDVFQALDGPAYFKIHGSIEPGLETTAIRTLAEECLLPKWKRELLNVLLANRTVVFLGYSGRDFELCPEIARIPLKQIVWITRSPSPPSVNAKALLQQVDGHILYGDMNDVLKEWLGSKPAVQASSRSATSDAIHAHFTAEGFCQWRLAILNRIGAPILAFRTLDSTTCRIDPHTATRQRAHAEMAADRYQSAARRFLSASVKEYMSKGRCIATDVLLDACDAYRIAGAMIQALLTFVFAKALACEQNRAKMFLKLALLIYSLHGLCHLQLSIPFVAGYTGI